MIILLLLSIPLIGVLLISSRMYYYDSRFSKDNAEQVNLFMQGAQINTHGIFDTFLPE